MNSIKGTANLVLTQMEKSLTPRDLVLWVVDNLQEGQPNTFTRIQKIIYLMQKQLVELYNFQPTYKFEGYMKHAGPYDRKLQKDMEGWFRTGCLEYSTFPYEKKDDILVPSHDVKTTSIGHAYAANHAIKNLENLLGHDSVKRIRTLLYNYNEKPEPELIQEAKAQKSAV